MHKFLRLLTILSLAWPSTSWAQATKRVRQGTNQAICLSNVVGGAQKDGVCVTAAGTAELKATATNDDACSTCVGYYIETKNASQLSQSSPGSGTLYDTGVTLAIPSAGDWDVHYGCALQIGMSGTGEVFGQIYLRESSNNLDASNGPYATTNQVNVTDSVNGYYRLKASAAQTLKISYRVVVASGSPTLGTILCRGDLGQYNYITARRAR